MKLQIPSSNRQRNSRHQTSKPRKCRRFVNLNWALLWMLALGPWSFSSSASPKNILLIIADDYGVDSNSLYNSVTNGASLPPTPNIHSLAQSGVLFRNAYANPLCSPTRATIITGRHAFRTGVGDVIAGAGSVTLSASEFTLPEAFAANSGLGYSLAQFGKWHLANGPNAPNTIGGWPHFSGSLQGAISSFTNWTKTVNGVSTANYTNYATTDLVNDAVAWIQARGTNAWFAWLAFNAPHTPLHKPPNDLHSYDALSGTQPNITANPRPYFEAMVEAMDTEIGRLLAAVDRTNTHIVFIGDNGTTANVIQPPYASNRGKSTLYEGGIHVPFIISSPAVINPGRIDSTPVNAVDLFSTILEMANINVATTIPTSIILDARSLMPLLQGASNLTRHAYSEIFNQSAPAAGDGRALRNTNFKLIQFNDGREEFYNLAIDPYERTNLLSRTLTEAEEGNYYSLLLKFSEMKSAVQPVVITGFSKTESQFSVSVQRTNNLVYALWRASALDEFAWRPVTNAALVTNSAASLTLTDTNALAAKTFYRVITGGPP
jgi:arylsulfatase A-like enzyme